MRIVVELKKDADAEVVLNQLYQYTPLQTTFRSSTSPWSTASPRR